MAIRYKNADNCKKCPQSNDANGCPWWWETIQTNTDTGEERVHKDCGKASLPMFMTEVIKASNRPAGEISAMREEISRSVNESVMLVLDQHVTLKNMPRVLSHES